MSHIVTEPIQLRDEFHDEFHDAASEISSLTISSSEDAASKPMTVFDDTDLASDSRAEAEDGYGELYSRPFPSRTANNKRFSTLSMASSIAAIMPFVTAPDNKLALGFNAPASDRGFPAKSSLSSDLEKPLNSYNRRRLRGSVPQLSLLLQRAAANAQNECGPSFSAKTVDEWASTLAKSFDIDSPTPVFALRYPIVETPPSSIAAASKPTGHTKQQESSRWRLRPLSTWRRKSMMNPLGTSAPAPAQTHATAEATTQVPALQVPASHVPASHAAWQGPLMNESLSSVAADNDSPMSAMSNPSASAANGEPQPAQNAAESGKQNEPGVGFAGTRYKSTKPDASSISTISTATTKESSSKAPNSRASSSRTGASWAAKGKRASIANVRNSRFWHIVRPSGESAGPSKEPASTAESSISELSGLPARYAQAPQNSGSRAGDGCASEWKSKDGADGADVAKPSRLRRFWKSIRANTSFPSPRHADKPCATF